jgi:hypothetical protein
LKICRSIYYLSLLESSIGVNTEWGDSIGNKILLSAFQVPHEAEEGCHDHNEGWDGESPCWREPNWLAMEFVANVGVAHSVFRAETSTNLARRLAFVLSEIAHSELSVILTISTESSVNAWSVPRAVPVGVDGSVLGVRTSTQLVVVRILNSSSECGSTDSAVWVEIAVSAQALELDGLALSVIAIAWRAVAVLLTVAVVRVVTQRLVDGAGWLTLTTWSAVIWGAVIVLGTGLAHSPVLVPPANVISEPSAIGLV